MLVMIIAKDLHGRVVNSWSPGEAAAAGEAGKGSTRRGRGGRGVRRGERGGQDSRGGRDRSAFMSRAGNDAADELDDSADDTPRVLHVPTALCQSC
eukprot:1875844-Pleurochrysis_carterae.AAC.1